MFIFSKRYSLIETDFFDDFVDYHSHLLPGVDDGIQILTDAVEVLEWYEGLGVKRAVLTPHIMELYSENSYQSLNDVFESFKRCYTGSVGLSLAAEYMLDSSFCNHLESGNLLTFWDNYLLVEMSYFAAPVNLFVTLRSVISKGYYVVLAHPERYLFLTKDDYRKLRDMGVLFQLNLPSICGGYGDLVTSRAEYLLDSTFYTILGSDLHSLRVHRHLFGEVKLKRCVIKKIEVLKDRSR